MKAVAQLHSSTKDKRIGNHRVEHCGHWIVKYFYYDTCICKVNSRTRQFYTDNGGYTTSSTTRAINVHKKELEKYGFTQVDKEAFPFD